MNILEQSMTVQDIVCNAWTLTAGAILFYILGGLTLRNTMVRYWAKKNANYGRSASRGLTSDQESGIFFAHIFFPISLIVIFVVCIGKLLGYLYVSDKIDEIYNESYDVAVKKKKEKYEQST